MLLRRITLQNLLSFGPDETTLELGPLNVVIGPNGSGTTNLIAAIGLLQAASGDLAAPIGETGGIGEWLHKSGSPVRRGSISAVVDCARHGGALHYRLSVEEQLHRFQVNLECVEDFEPADERSTGILSSRFSRS